MTYKKIVILAAVIGTLAVIFGAFGAHALADRLSEKQLSSYKTGNTYQFYHVLLLLLIGIIYKLRPSRTLRYAAWSCITGILLFSGSLYLLACKDLIGIENTMILGPMTPIGGVFFVVSWILILVNAIGEKDE